jgi:hypothetical protein
MSLKTCSARALLLASATVALGAIPASASSGFTIRVANSGAGGDPGYFYVGGPLNVTVSGPAPAKTFEVCMTPAPIDRASCRHGRVGRTVDSLGAPSKAGHTKLRVRFGPNQVYVRYIRVRKA